jgi:hypothetical protein
LIVQNDGENCFCRLVRRDVTVPFVLTRLSTNADHEMRPPSFQCLIDCLVKISDCPSASCHSRPAVVKLLIRPSTPKYTTRDPGAQADYFFCCRPLSSIGSNREAGPVFNQMFIFIYRREEGKAIDLLYGIINPILPVLFKRIH